MVKEAQSSYKAQIDTIESISNQTKLVADNIGAETGNIGGVEVISGLSRIKPQQLVEEAKRFGKTYGKKRDDDDRDRDRDRDRDNSPIKNNSLTMQKIKKRNRNNPVLSPTKMNLLHKYNLI